MDEQNRKRLQEIFDLGAVGILRQAKKSMGPGLLSVPSCAYRGEDGCKCFIGHAIPDDRYDPELEGFSVDYRPVRAALGLPDETLVPALYAFQSIHDNVEPEYWLQALEVQARSEGLDTSCLDEFRAQENA